MKNRLTKIAAAVIIVAVIGGFVATFTGGNGGGGVAWADVIQPIMTARTVIYNITVSEQGDGPVIRDMIMGSRIRRSMSNTESVSIIDLESLKGWDALFVDKDRSSKDIDLLLKIFDRVGPIEESEIKVNDTKVRSFYIIRCYGYKARYLGN